MSSRRSDDDLAKALRDLRGALLASPPGRLLVRTANRLNSLLEPRQDRWWFRTLDTLGRWSWNVYVVLFALVGAGMAGWALAKGIWGVVFAFPVGIGAWLILKYGRAE